MSIIDQEVAPICWAEIANKPENRVFRAFKWENGRRVPSNDPNTGAPLFDRRPLKAHYGNNMTGVREAPVTSVIKFLRHDGILVDTKINNSPAHIVDGDDRYQRGIMRKARHFGWIAMGECPAMLVASGAIPAHRVLATSARTGQCSHDHIGFRNPPCPHFLAEYEARTGKSREDYLALLENFKSSEAKQIEAQAKASLASVEKHDKVLSELAAAQATIATLLAAQAQAAPKGGK